jgi:RNA polymerase sigma factor (sigma-70 family)
MQRSEELWARAHRQAECYLRRYADPWTKSHCEDLVQEAAIAAWRWAQEARHPLRFWAAVRTIAMRTRIRGLRHAQQRRIAQSEAAIARLAGGTDPVDDRSWTIAGRRVPVERAAPCLRQALQRLHVLDRQLLLGFHEGFCCAELAARFRRSEPWVKTRLHRARRRVQQDVEACVCTVDDLDW